MVIINSFKYPESNIRFEQRDVRVILDHKDLGLGTLFVSDSTLCWQQQDDIGLTIGYHKISLHAISKDVNLYPRECIYIILDGHISLPGENSDADVTYNSENESIEDVSELILVPEQISCIQPIYEAIKVCQELNPDPNDVDEEDNIYEDAEDDMDEGEYIIQERGGGDGDMEELNRRMQSNSVDIHYNYSNGNNDDDEEFQDAD